jgi:superfamily I DNA/RNA helicase
METMGEKKMGRIVCVGDSKQAIYGFRGADTASIPDLITRLGAVVFPLSISYRCAKAIIKEAQAFVPDIEPAPNAVEGEIKYMNDTDIIQVVQPKDFILCRINAPLVSTCFKLLRAGKKAYVKGRDIGTNLINFIETFCKDNQDIPLNDLVTSIMEYRDAKVVMLQGQGKELEAIAVEDKCDTLLVFCENVKSVIELKLKIEAMFLDNSEGVCLSTVHKAKGLETDTVYILKPEVMPHPKAKSAWQQEQELNLKYVAITRAKNTLVWVKTTDK